MTSPSSSSSSSSNYEIADLAGGCFWCLEAVYDEVAGVVSAESGYQGGAVPNPSYDAVCSGRTGHAEVVRVVFDPAIVKYGELLEVFFAIHDPTTLNRQGQDVGTQYRSEIFVHGPEQRAIAEETIRRLTEAREFSSPIVTKVTDAPPFYPAEDYHEEYFARNPNAGYCRMIIAPKVAKFRKLFADRLATAKA